MAVIPQKPASKPSGWETIEELFAALEPSLMSYALRVSGQPGVAEDIVQEAFMRLHAQFDDVREPRRWLYRTVHNLAISQRREAGKTVSLHGPAEDSPPQAAETDPQPLPDEQIARWEGIGLVRLSVGALDERSRELLRLKFNEGLSYKEIGARTGLSVGNVGYLLHQAVKAAGRELAKNGIVP
jgi:RNA polymerase sigma factor (sigma-70 family)